MKQQLNKFTLLLVIYLLLPACACQSGKKYTDIEIFTDMLQQASIKAQEGSSEGKSQMLSPPENTRARNQNYYLYKGEPNLAEQNLKNPFKGNTSPSLIGLGQRQYEKACMICHGVQGDGQGLVAKKMAVKPPSLLTDKVMHYSDGRIYHIIHEGQGLMGAYKKQVSKEKDRWALINYIRMLQTRAMKNKQ